MWGYVNGYGWVGMIFGMVSMLLFWALLIAAVVVLAKHVWGSDRSTEGRQEKTALDILKERYARGEIEREEFQQKKLDLEG